VKLLQLHISGSVPLTKHFSGETSEEHTGFWWEDLWEGDH